MSYLPWDVNDWFSQHVVVGSKEAQRIEAAPQGSKLWHEARKLRASGSRVGAIVGLGFFGTTAKSLTKLFVWPSSGSSIYLTWGNACEILAQKACEDVLRQRFETMFAVDFEYPGGMVINGDEWFIASVDGLCNLRDKSTGTLVETLLLEFKCPKKIHDTIKPEYYAQIQSYMGFLQRHNVRRFYAMRRCVFAQWTPEKMVFAEYPYNHDWFTQLRTEARATYFAEILPRLMLKSAGLLTEGNHRLLPGTEDSPAATARTPRVTKTKVGGTTFSVEAGGAALKRFRRC